MDLALEACICWSCFGSIVRNSTSQFYWCSRLIFLTINSPEFGLPSSFAGASPEPWSSCPAIFKTQKVEIFQQTPGSPPAGSSAGSFLNLEILVETLFASSRVKHRSFPFSVSMRSISVIRARAWSLRTTGHPDCSQHFIFPNLGYFTAHPARDHVMVYPNSASPLRGTIGSTGSSDKSVPFMGFW